MCFIFLVRKPCLNPHKFTILTIYCLMRVSDSFLLLTLSLPLSWAQWRYCDRFLPYYVYQYLCLPWIWMFAGLNILEYLTWHTTSLWLQMWCMDIRISCFVWRTHTHTRTHACARTYACTRTRVRSHARTHIHTQDTHTATQTHRHTAHHTHLNVRPIQLNARPIYVTAYIVYVTRCSDIEGTGVTDIVHEPLWRGSHYIYIYVYIFY